MTGASFSPCRILCLGNELACDDGVAIRVGRVLARLPLPSGVELVVASAVGLDLLEAVSGTARLVVVDATVTGGRPGALTTLTGEQLQGLDSTPYCCHAIGLPELLLLAARLEPDRRAPEISFVGVEAVVLDRFGTALTPAVAATVPDAVEAVLTAIGAEPSLRSRARALSRRVLREPFSLVEPLAGGKVGDGSAPSSRGH